jgi:putative molybdopterin biosynthesis protein
MGQVKTIHSLDQIKILSDPRRLAILRLLMDRPSSITRLARAMGESPAWVKHHIQPMLNTGLIELSHMQKSGKATEKFYRSRADAFLLQQILTPKSRLPVIIFSGSHDLALEAMAQALAEKVRLISMNVGSLNGLVNLRQGICQFSGSHLPDQDGQYNLAYVRMLFPDIPMEVFTLAYRTQGWMFLPGYKRSPKVVSDLVNPRLRFVNRNPGSATRLWLDVEIKKAGIAPSAIHGYDKIATTHTEAAALIKAGKADAALGLQAAAEQNGLDFMPLFEERYDVILPREHERSVSPLLDYLQTNKFRQATDQLGGYSTVHSGEQILV